MEHGATRNFQAEKLIEEEEKRIQQEREEEELNNPMKVSVLKVILCSYLNWHMKHRMNGFPILDQVLENRTKDSKLEMEVLENLQELKELNQRQALVDFEGMIDQYREMEKREREREKEEDEREMKWVVHAQKNCLIFFLKNIFLNNLKHVSYLIENVFCYNI